MTDDIPEDLEGFLGWFKERTEAAWANYPTISFSDLLAGDVASSDWRAGTKWRAGLGQQEVDALEARWNVRLPLPFRSYLSILNAPDRGMFCVGWNDDAPSALVEVDDEPSFYDWQRDEEDLEGAFKWPLNGLLFDVENAGLWPVSWGQKPEEAQIPARVSELVAAAPALIPIYEHRYLLAHPVSGDYPVLSVWQSDIIFYGSNLRNYLLLEMAEFIGPKHGLEFEAANSDIRPEDVQAIPFWGELMLAN